MARVTIEDCLDKEQNRFRLVHLATARAKQLLQGADAQVETDNKSIVTALREIAAGLVRFKTPEECQEDRLKAASEEKNKVSETEQEKAKKALDSLFENFSANATDDDFDDEDEEGQEEDDLVYEEESDADDNEEDF